MGFNIFYIKHLNQNGISWNIHVKHFFRKILNFYSWIAYATSQISDAVRGTIVVKTTEELEKTIANINEYVKAFDGKILWRNYYKNPAETGYIGVHANILNIFKRPDGKIRQIISEIQIHDESINDGSHYCIKERMHKVYKKNFRSLDECTAKCLSKWEFFIGILTSNSNCIDPNFLTKTLEKKPAIISSKNLWQSEQGFCEKTLKIPRCEMQQLSEPVKKRFNKMHLYYNVTFSSKISQKADEIVKELIYNQFDSCEELILSKQEGSDIKVLDGHYRWTSCKTLDRFINTVVFCVQTTIEFLHKCLLKLWIL